MSVSQHLLEVMNKHLSVEEVSASGGELEYMVVALRPDSSLDDLAMGLLEVLHTSAPKHHMAWVQEGDGFSIRQEEG